MILNNETCGRMGQIRDPNPFATYIDNARAPSPAQSMVQNLINPTSADMMVENITVPQAISNVTMVETPSESWGNIEKLKAKVYSQVEASQAILDEQLMIKWGAESPAEAAVIEFWVTDPVGFAKAAVRTYNNMATEQEKLDYQTVVTGWIVAHTASELYEPFFTKMDIGTLGAFGWTFLPQFRDYYWGRHAAWNTQDFVSNISDSFPAITDPAAAEDFKTGALTALTAWAGDDWITKVSAATQAKFLKAFFPEEIEAAAAATKKAGDLNKVIGISIAALIGGTLIFSLAGKKRPATVAVKK